MAEKIRIGVLISGSGTNLQAIIDSCESGKINGDITFVGSDNPDALGIVRSKKRGITTFVVDYRPIIQSYKKDSTNVSLPDDFDLDDVLSKQNLFSSNTPPEKVRSFFITRAVAEAKLIDKMKPYPFDLLVLAGFMRNLTPYFIDKINTDLSNSRIMNIHPALLPSFPGVDGYGDTFRYGCKIGGCTIHFIDYGEDSGPIIDQRAFRITDDDTLESIKEKGLKLEWELYPECIDLFARGRLKIIRMLYELENGKKIEKNVVKIL